MTVILGHLRRDSVTRFGFRSLDTKNFFKHSRSTKSRCTKMVDLKAGFTISTDLLRRFHQTEFSEFGRNYPPLLLLLILLPVVTSSVAATVPSLVGAAPPRRRHAWPRPSSMARARPAPPCSGPCQPCPVLVLAGPAPPPAFALAARAPPGGLLHARGRSHVFFTPDAWVRVVGRQRVRGPRQIWSFQRKCPCVKLELQRCQTVFSVDLRSTVELIHGESQI